MKNQIGMLFFLGALASALLVGACGADDDCDALCDKALECEPEGSRRQCMKYCEEMDFPPEFIECATSLSCEPSEEESRKCMRKLKVSRECKTYCAKACVDADESCGVDCTFSLPPQMQKCLAEIDGETCAGEDECFFGMPLPPVE